MPLEWMDLLPKPVVFFRESLSRNNVGDSYAISNTIGSKRVRFHKGSQFIRFCDMNPGIMEESIYIRDDIVIPPREIWFTASHSGGPGGQHVNTTNSRVTLYWNAAATTCLSESQKTRVLRRLASRISTDGILQLVVDSERSRHQNLRIAREKLATLVQAALVVPKKRIPTKTTKGANRRRLEQKTLLGRIKQQRMKPRAEE